MYRVFDYRCATCLRVKEYLLETPVPETIPCINLLSVKPENISCPGVMSKLPPGTLGITIVKGNHDFAQRETERLDKRSHDHFLRKGKEEAIEREKIIKKKAGWLL